MSLALAATVVVLQDGDAGLECLMVRKTSGQAFGGAWVFPGGRVEPEDGEGAEGIRRAAVREAREETGLRLDAELLTPFSHWVPPAEAPRRYSTWFFLTPFPRGVVADVVTDGGEIADHTWTGPAAALAAHRRGEMELHPPTWLTLYELKSHDDAARAVDAAEHPVPRFSTRMVSETDGAGAGMLVALWHPDAAYPDGETDPVKPLETPGERHRLYLDPAGWRYERSP